MWLLHSCFTNRNASLHCSLGHSLTVAFPISLAGLPKFPCFFMCASWKVSLISGFGLSFLWKNSTYVILLNCQRRLPGTIPVLVQPSEVYRMYKEWNAKTVLCSFALVFRLSILYSQNISLPSVTMRILPSGRFFAQNLSDLCLNYFSPFWINPYNLRRYQLPLATSSFRSAALSPLLEFRWSSRREFHRSGCKIDHCGGYIPFFLIKHKVWFPWYFL